MELRMKPFPVTRKIISGIPAATLDDKLVIDGTGFEAAGADAFEELQPAISCRKRRHNPKSRMAEAHEIEFFFKIFLQSKANSNR